MQQEQQQAPPAVATSLEPAAGASSISAVGGGGCSSSEDVIVDTSGSNNSRQDYRMNLTEVESTLAAVPEDSALVQPKVLPAATEEDNNETALLVTSSHGVTSSPMTAISMEQPSTSGMTAATAATAASNPVFFHIPESNASDMGMSECSVATTTNATNSDFLSQLTTKTEALSARQQVALWLTRTSMSDLSSMPSLKNLVSSTTAAASGASQQPQYSQCNKSSNSKKRQNYYQHRFGGKARVKASCTKAASAKSVNNMDHPNSSTPSKANTKKTKANESNPTSMRKKLIQRNYSTKSLMGGFSFGLGGGGGCSSPPPPTKGELRTARSSASGTAGTGSRKNSDKNCNDCEDDDDEDEDHGFIRKCETVTALSGLTSNRSSFANLNGGRNRICCGVIADERTHCHRSSKPYRNDCSSKRKSSLSIFKRLSRGGNSSRSQCGGNLTPHFTSNAFHSECESPFPGIRPVNRLRSTTSSIMCSRCSSASLSMATNSRITSRATSQMSLFQINRSSRISSINHAAVIPAVTAPTTATSNLDLEDEEDVFCKICLVEYAPKEMAALSECGCMFCKDCMVRYITFEVMAGAYDISCPDQECDKQGVLKLSEVEEIVGKELGDKYRGFRLNTEVALDSNRAWCPSAGCETICHICTSSSASGTNLNKASAVKCPSCQKEFCSLCSANWHPGMTCQEYGSQQMAKWMPGESNGGGGGGLNTPSLMGDILLLNDGQTEIKRCPMCHVPIERDAGCAQMMCKRCKHVFCWFCLTSLDEDFLLRHYDSGECKGRLGHTRASVLWHRAQVIGIFAGFGIMLVVASPLLLLAAPCILFCDCKHRQFPYSSATAANLEQQLDSSHTQPASPASPASPSVATGNNKKIHAEESKN